MYRYASARRAARGRPGRDGPALTGPRPATATARPWRAARAAPAQVARPSRRAAAGPRRPRGPRPCRLAGLRRPPAARPAGTGKRPATGPLPSSRHLPQDPERLRRGPADQAPPVRGPLAQRPAGPRMGVVAELALVALHRRDLRVERGGDVHEVIRRQAGVP